MPAQDQRSKLGTSSSPIINRVIEQAKCNQKPITSVAQAHTKTDAKVSK